MVLALAEVYLILAVYLAYVGFGVTHLLLPISLQRWRLILMPFLGYAVTVLIFAGLNTYLLTGQQITLVLLAAATGLNLLAVLRLKDRHTHSAWRDSLLPILLSLATYAIATLPLLNYGMLTIVGTNGDVEQYLGSAEYVRQYSVPAMAAAPPNPLQSLALWVVSDPLGNMGFSYVLALVAILLRWPVLQVFAPTVAFFVAANAVTAYLFARISLRMSARGGALTALAVGLNSLILWAGFFNYGRQIASLSLLPLGAIAFATCLEEFKPRSTLLAALLFAALALTYWPAAALLLASMTLFTVITIAGGLRAPAKGKLVGVGTATFVILAIGSLPLAANLLKLSRVMFDAWHETERGTAGTFAQTWLSNLLGIRIVSPLPDFFLPIEHVFGLAYYVWPKPESAVVRFGPIPGQILDSTETLIAVLALCLSLYGFWRAARSKRYMVASLAVMAALQLAGVRFLSHNTYYYFKTLTFSAFLASALVMLGLTELWRVLSQHRRTVVQQWSVGALALFGIAFLFMNSVNAYSTVNYFLDRPQSPFVSPYLDVQQVNQLIAPEASICLSSHPALQQETMSVVSVALIGHPLYGDVRTIESSLDKRYLEDPRMRYFTVRGRDVGVERYPCDYALLAAQEEPTDKGYAAQDLLWSNTLMKLYRRGPTVARLEFDARRRGEVTSKEPLEIMVQKPALETSHAGNPGGEGATADSLVLQFGSFVDQRLSIEINGEKMERQISPGLWRYQSNPVELPATIRIDASGKDPLLMSWVDLTRSTNPAASLARQENGVVLRAGITSRAGRFVARVRWLGPISSPVPGWIELRVQGRSIPDEESLITTWPLEGKVGLTEVSLDRTTKQVEASQPSSPSGLARWSPPEGPLESFATEIRVVFADIAHDIVKQQVMELFYVKRQADGRIDSTPFETWFLYPQFPRRSWQTADAVFGGTARLIGYDLEEQDLRPGEDAHLSLYWQVPRDFDRDWRVFTRLVDRNGQTWGQHDQGLLSARRFQNGSTDSEILRQDYHIPLSEEIPTGKYIMEVGLYLPDSMEHLRATGKGVRDSDRVAVNWVKVAGDSSSLSGASFEPRHPTNVDLGGQVRFLGYDLRPSAPRSDDSLELTLYWQADADREIGEDYTVFVHLLDQTNTARLGHDEQPLQGQYPTSAWSPGETVADRHTVNLDKLAPGEYEIEVGLYSLSTGKRLAIGDGSESEQDRILLGSIQVQ
ncbi:MAG: hypothetical protein EPO21_11850 [Chloroflexota bacterium]|nr:MAG: hypothetical protein EPO21_11850 [Chloroflexota bacterium]